VDLNGNVRQNGKHDSIPDTDLFGATASDGPLACNEAIKSSPIILNQ